MLIICEKYNSAKRIGLILSNNKMKTSSISGVRVFNFRKNDEEYVVIGLRGHIIKLDYPSEYNRWDKNVLTDLVWVNPITIKTSEKTVHALQSLAKEHDKIVIATDYDREGELIGVESIKFVKKSNNRIIVKRAKFSTLTFDEIKMAFQNLGEVDYNLANSAYCRQIIDLVWGAVLTRFISLVSNQKGKEFLSVGRVQTPTLALIVNREHEISNFVSEPYWRIVAKFKEGFSAKTDTYKLKNFVDNDYKKVSDAEKGIIIKFAPRIHIDYPPIPFNTTLFLSEAAKLGFNVHTAMRIAEDLYTNGYISYPRTDNTVYPSVINLRNVLKKLTVSDLGDIAKELLETEIKPTRGKTETTDHPPIYPVGAAKKSQLDKNHWTIYELVVRRFFATLAQATVWNITDVEIVINDVKFYAEGSQIKEWGWRKYYPYEKIAEVYIPDLSIGSKLSILDVKLESRRTQPPRRYTQSILIQQMERLGLGTKSTRHEIIQKLYERKYIYGSKIKPAKTGIAVIDALEKYANVITKPNMTATLESDMNRIVVGERTVDNVVKESQAMLHEILNTLLKNEKSIGDAIISALKEQAFMGKCKCGGDLSIIQFQKDKRFVGCSNYPDCNVKYPISHNLKILPTDESCECGLSRVKIMSTGETICINPDCISGKIGKCKCGGDLRIIRTKKNTRFIGCTTYPECTITYPLPQTGKLRFTKKTCAICKLPIFERTYKRKKIMSCVNPECRDVVRT